MIYLIAILTSVGTSVITCAAMEAYYQRVEQNKIYDYDQIEEGRHSR